MKRKTKKTLCIVASVLLALGLVYGAVTAVGWIGVKINTDKYCTGSDYQATLTPQIDTQTGYWTFVTDEDFITLQLTDIHLGGGAASIRRDGMALDAVRSLIEKAQPDLVIVTGDIAYPVPFQTGTLSNLRGAKMFAELMESLEVYWAPVFGNHDCEIYSYYNQAEIADFYENSDFKYCLFQSGEEAVDGIGNYFINVKNTSGLITRSFIMMDSHSYTDGDYLGVQWKYDSIHANQIEWYEGELGRLNALNTAINGEQSDVKSLLFMHIPMQEYLTAWTKYLENGNTENVTYEFGKAGVGGRIVYCSYNADDMFETVLKLGSTQGVFCGHDHKNNFSVTYKGIQLTYGMSVAYTANIGIWKDVGHRGGTVITTTNEGGFSCEQLPLEE